MRSDAIRLLHALVGSELGPKDAHPESVVPQGCVVALTRTCACGGEEIAQLLAGKLGVRCFDKELLETVVREAHLDREILERLDERPTGLEDWVYGILFGRNATP